jgi:nucleotide-binding universal stress UspA family protein
MYRRVLVPIDGVRLDESLAAAIPQVTGSRDVEVVLMRVLEPISEDSKEGSRGRLLNRMFARTEEASNSMARIAIVLRAYVRGVTTVIRCGEPVAEILDAARELDVNFIAMRPYRRMGRHGGPFDPVAEGVLRNAGIPVLIVPPARRVLAVQTERGWKPKAHAGAA